MLRMSIWRYMTSRLFPTGLPAATACMSDAFQSVYRKKQQRAERISAASPISLQNHRHMGAPYPFVCGQPHSSRRSGGGGYRSEERRGGKEWVSTGKYRGV